MEARNVTPYAVFAARLLIGSLFVYASLHKIADPLGFAGAIRNYLILPEAWSNLAALTLPWIELVAGAFLIVGVQTRPAALLTTTMLAVFLAALVYAYSIGLDIDCGCFSSKAQSKGRVDLYHLVRDSTLFVTSFFILVMDNEEFRISRLLQLGRLRTFST